MPTLTLFHSSLNSEINKFHPLSHFGSYKQAIIVSRNKIFRMRKNLNEVTSYLYEVELTYSDPSEILTIKDGGSPRARMLLINYTETFENNTKRRTHIIESNAYAEKNGIDPDVEAKNRILRLAKEKGHTIFSYENSVEIDHDDNISYCVINPDLIKIVNLRKISHTELK